MEITNKQLDKLIAGFPPQIVNHEWDYETIVIELAKIVKEYRNLGESIEKPLLTRHFDSRKVK
jgi:hypothetical protein